MTEHLKVHPEPQTAVDFEQEALKHVWIHSAEWIRLAEERGFRVFERAYGSTLVDVYGREYIDGLSGLWVVNAGHGRREIAEAMAEQAAKIAYVSSANHTTVPTVRLAHQPGLAAAGGAPGDGGPGRLPLLR